MSTELNQGTISEQLAPVNNRVYYTYGDLEIDLKHYIHNLNTNLNRFLDSRRNWSEGQKLAFRERFEILKLGLLTQLESGGDRFNTGTNGITNDLEGEISNGKDVIYIDSEGNTYSSEGAEDESNLTAFDVSKELGNYANRIGGAIAVRGLNKDYYTKLEEAKARAVLLAANREALRQSSNTVQTESPEAIAFDSTKYGTIPFLQSDTTLYNSTEGKFNWDGVYALDASNPQLYTNRNQALANRIAEYYKQILLANFDFAQTTYGSKENFLEAVKTAHDALLDGYLELDNAALNAIGLDNDFLGNWFSSVSPEERAALAEREAKKTQLLTQLNVNPVDLSQSFNLEAVLPVDKSISFSDNKEDSIAIPSALDQLAKSIGVPAPHHENTENVSKFFEDIKEKIVQGLLTKKDIPQTTKLINSLIAYDKILDKHNPSGPGNGNFVKGEDGLYYLDYRNTAPGVVVVWDGNNSVYLKNLAEAENSPIYNKILDLLNSEVTSNKLGGKFADGGELALLNHEAVVAAQGTDSKKKFEHGAAKFGWNSLGTTSSDESFNMEYEDYARLVTLAANIGSIFADPITGAAIGIGADIGDLTADLADESLTGLDAAKNFAVNLGLDVVSLIPGGETTKIARGISSITDTLMKGIAAYGVLDTVKNGPEIIGSIKNIAQGDWNRLDVQNASRAVLLLATAILGGKSLKKQSNVAKAASLPGAEEIGIRVKIGDEAPKDIKIRGAKANAIRENKNNLDEINKILKTIPGLENAVADTKLKTIPLKFASPIQMTGESKGLHWPVQKRVTPDVFETKIPDNIGFGFKYPESGPLSKRTLYGEYGDVAAATTKTAEATDINIPRGVSDESSAMMVLTNEELKEHPLILEQIENTAGKKQALAKVEGEINLALSNKNLATEAIALARLARTEAENTLSQIAKSKAEGFNISFKGKPVNDNDSAAEYLGELAKKKEGIVKAISTLETKSTNKKLELKVRSAAKKELEIQKTTLGRLEEEIDAVTKFKESIGKLAERTANKSFKEAEDAILSKEEEEKLQLAILDKLGIKKEAITNAPTGLKDLEDRLLNGMEIELNGQPTLATVTKEDFAKLITDLGLMYKKGGILKCQHGTPAGIGYTTGSTWEGTVGKDTWDRIIELLTALNGNKEEILKYAKNINQFLDNHAAIRKEAYGHWDKNNSYTGANNSVGNYLTAYQNGGWNDAAIGKHWDRYDLSVRPNTRYLKDRASAGWKSDNLYAGITDDRRLLGRYDSEIEGELDDYGNGLLDQKNAILKNFGLLMYLDPTTKYYKLKPLDNTTDPTQTTPPATPNPNNLTTPEYLNEDEEDYEDPSFDEVNGLFGGPDDKEMIDPTKNVIETLREKVPDMAEYLRMRWLNSNADKLTNMALEGQKPFLLDPYEVHRYVVGNYRAKAEGELAAASLLSQASKPLTSDGALQTAVMLEAKEKGQKYIDAGNKADDARTLETLEKSWLLEKDNVYNAWKIAMENRRNTHTTNLNRNNIKHAGESVKLNNENTYWMDVIKKARDAADTRSEEIETANMKDIARVAMVNPKAIGIDLNNDEQIVLNAVANEGMTYSLLPDNYKLAYLTARQKLQWAESNYLRKYKNLPKSPYEDAINEGLNESYVQVTDTPAFKDGGLITVAKIKEKIKNADRHLKNIHKQIDSLDKKLDRISKNMHGPGKVAQLR